MKACNYLEAPCIHRNYSINSEQEPLPSLFKNKSVEVAPKEPSECLMLELMQLPFAWSNQLDDNSEQKDYLNFQVVAEELRENEALELPFAEPNELIDNPEEDHFYFGGDFEMLVEAFREEEILELPFAEYPYLNDIFYDEEDQDFIFRIEVDEDNELREHHRQRRDRRAQRNLRRRQDLQRREEIIRRNQQREREVQLQREIQQFLKDAFPFQETDIEPYDILCPICMSRQTEITNFDCEDYFCKSCSVLLLENFLNSGKVMPEQLKCPCCEAQISDDAFKNVLPADYPKLERLRRKIRIQKQIAEGLAIGCPLPDCEGYALVSNEKTIMACNECLVTLCPNCKESSHPNMTCEEYSIEKGDGIEDLLVSRHWKRCPSCGIPVERIEGCNFVTCNSPICAGSKSMCYVCGMSVVEAQHYSHYTRNGPFGTTCNTVDGLPETFEDS